MAKLIKLSVVNEKPLDREKYLISVKKEIEQKKQNECNHYEIEVDSDEDKHNCLQCGKTLTAHEYLVFKATSQTPMKTHSYSLKNQIHFLKLEIADLESYVKSLKSQKHKLSSFITREKNKNNITHNDWNE